MALTENLLQRFNLSGYQFILMHLALFILCVREYGPKCGNASEVSYTRINHPLKVKDVIFNFPNFRLKQVKVFTNRDFYGVHKRYFNTFINLKSKTKQPYVSRKWTVQPQSGNAKLVRRKREDFRTYMDDSYDTGRSESQLHFMNKDRNSRYRQYLFPQIKPTGASNIGDPAQYDAWPQNRPSHISQFPGQFSSIPRKEPRIQNNRMSGSQRIVFETENQNNVPVLVAHLQISQSSTPNSRPSDSNESDLNQNSMTNISSDNSKNEENNHKILTSSQYDQNHERQKSKHEKGSMPYYHTTPTNQETSTKSYSSTTSRSTLIPTHQQSSQQPQKEIIKNSEYTSHSTSMSTLGNQYVTPDPQNYRPTSQSVPTTTNHLSHSTKPAYVPHQQSTQTSPQSSLHPSHTYDVTQSQAGASINHESVHSNRSSCLIPPQPGDCLAAFPRYYYRRDLDQCDCYFYGGCRSRTEDVEFQVLFSLQECLMVCDPGNSRPGPNCKGVLTLDTFYFDNKNGRTATTPSVT